MSALWANTHIFTKLFITLAIAVLFLCILKILHMYQQRSAHLIEFWTVSNEQSKQKIDHKQWQVILDHYLINDPSSDINLFDYSSVSEEHKTLIGYYINDLVNIDPRELNRLQQLAYWINLYNALTVNLVIQHYPADSIRDIGNDIPGFGPWDDKVATIVRQTLTLNQIEHGILRSNWKDSRIHYAINCASLGCPNLSLNVYEAETLDAQLDMAARRFINHPRAVSWVKGELQLSSIYDWFMDDFGGNERFVIKHIQKYASPKLRHKLKQYSGKVNYDYDWQLNHTSADISHHLVVKEP